MDLNLQLDITFLPRLFTLLLVDMLLVVLHQLNPLLPLLGKPDMQQRIYPCAVSVSVSVDISFVR